MKLYLIFFLLISTIFFSEFILPQNYNSVLLKSEAFSLMNSARYGEAIDLLNKYVAENPQRADGFNLRGLCYEKRGNYEFAVYDFRTAKKLSPNDKEIASNLNRATQDWYKLLYNKIEGHKREIAINPNSAKNYLEIGKCYKNLGEWNIAEEWYDIYLEKEDASSDEILRYTEILAKLNHISKGEPILKSYTEKFPTDHRLWSRYGYFQLWLGKNKQAIESFSKSLELRPYFKEALDGMDLAKGKGYVYSINDTTAGFNYGMAPAPKEYLIDKYYRQLKTNPDNEELRFRLVEELIKAKRFEEANEQLVILSKNYSQDARYLDLLSTTTTLRKSYYADRIRYFEDMLSKNPKDKRALLELGKFHSYNQNYDLALKYFRQYLMLNPDDMKVKFNVVEILTWQNKLCEAQIEVGKLIKQHPEDPNYNLMFAKINFWLDQNLDEAETAYNKVLSKDSNNKEALSGLTFIQLRKENIDGAKITINKLESIDNSVADLPLMKKSLSDLESRLRNQKLIELLDNARLFVNKNNYDDAIKLFNDYLLEDKLNTNVKRELADVYLLNNDYSSAIKIYDEILKSNYNYDVDKQRAKIIYWHGDSLLAVKEFRKVSQKNPNDIEAKLFLGDAYLKAGQTQNAKIVYEDLLSSSPNSHILKQRLNWAGGSGKFALETFPTYIQLIPKGSYFVDNTEFELSNLGLSLDLGVTKNIALGITGSGGNLKSAGETLRYTAIKGTAYLKLTETILSSVSFGKSYFDDDNEENIVEVNLSAQKKNIYQFSASLNYSDAAFILYSPFLVNARLNAYYYNFLGSYKLKNNIILSGRYAYIDVSDDNSSNLFQFRLGKEFEDDFTAGYEYYYYNVRNFTELYWSPDNFESHSLWADWFLFKEDNSDLSIGGKVGLIPQNNYILYEFYASFNYPFTSLLFFNAKFVTSSSYRSNVGYRSNSIQASLFWNL
jgi:Flp pilus assembly protein TadD